MPHPKDTFAISPEDFEAELKSGDIVIPPKELTKIVHHPERGREGLVSLFEALRIMTPELFRGPEQVEQVFGFRPEEIPIPFSIVELERAKELKQKLRRRVSRFPGGTLFSALNMNSILAPKFEAKQKGAVAVYLPKGDWKRGESCWETEAPEDKWVLTDDELVPGSLGQDFFEETDLLIDRLNESYKNLTLPALYQGAIAEYKMQKVQLQTLAADNAKWPEAAKRLSEFAITKLLRPSVSELCQDLFSEYLLTDRQPLPGLYSRTRSLSRDGNLVGVGCFGAGGVSGGGWRPGDRSGDMGASFSRSPR